VHVHKVELIFVFINIRQKVCCLPGNSPRTRRCIIDGDVVNDLRFEDKDKDLRSEDKDKDLRSKDKDKDLWHKNKDKDL